MRALRCLLGCLFACALGRTDESKGLLTAECVRSYFRMLVTRRVPPRSYLYLHETLPPPLPGWGAGAANFTDVNFRIVGGDIVSIKEVPYQVLYGRYCGGTLIAPQWVITAAHCKEKENYVYAGSTQRSRATKYRICAHFTHPLWNATGPSHDYDYQLALLETPVPVTDSSRPIAIGSFDDIVPGSMVAISGWGHLQFKKSRMQDLLHRVYVPVIANDVCRELPSGFFTNITARMFCAGFMEGHKDSCQGDSGGPAVARGKLVGIVSFGVSCAMPGKPGVYSVVPAARDWIRSVTALPL